MASSKLSVSAQPPMAVSGVRSSWDTEEMNSVCSFSLRATSSERALISSASRPNSSSPTASVFRPKLPSVMRLAKPVSVVRLSVTWRT